MALFLLGLLSRSLRVPCKIKRSKQTGENPANIKTARQAVDVIAQQRNSTPLRSWLQTGELIETEMDVGQAYARLDITERTVDDDLVLSAFNSVLQDQPSQEAELKKALTAIAKDRNSATLKNFVSDGKANNEHNRSEWPVGLENIGNTCYLNSLLQFYFTIKPLRELVLNFEKYKVDLDRTDFGKKQVGSRQVSEREVKRAQRFVLELGKLFESMISSNRDSITPDIELARLTLLSSSTEETYRRRSTLKSSRPSLGEIEGKPIHGPQPAAISEDVASEHESTTVTGDAPQMVQTPVSVMTTDEEVASEATLVEKPASIAAEVQAVQQQANALEDKENMAPSKPDVVRPMTPESPLKPLTNASPSRINEQQPSTDSHAATSNANGRTEDKSQAIPAAPTRSPPPVPPRNKPADRREEIKKEVEFGAQQDVTEVISNVLFQLQCAIKADSVDASGEQIDLVKNLFFGKQKVTTTAKDGKARTKEEFFSDIKVQVSSGPRTIYEALDAAFDLQQVEVGTSKEPQYTSISLLPPILQLHVSRAQYDKDKGTFKANHHLDFRKTIYMDRYMDSDDPEFQKKRQECWDWKKSVASMQKRIEFLRMTRVSKHLPLRHIGLTLCRLASQCRRRWSLLSTISSSYALAKRRPTWRLTKVLQQR